ncbi:MAG: inorganic phosphate transporter, partial [Candidatus Cloacimonetes bacterium]|nr:inorganic phosphate transporter [Candidatus Cloacimonadota bacterium]
LPVSTSQAIVGAIIGWNIFSGSITDYNPLSKILSTWILSPILAALFSLALFKLFKFILNHARIHLLELDLFSRLGLIIVGAFGAYSLGANNIANVMGVFVPAAPFRPINIAGIMYFSGAQQLFFLGALAIGAGIFTYSLKVMRTVGKDLFRLSPLTALIVILAESLVLFIFASRGLQGWLISLGLPPLPLVPVSSSQAVIGAVLGVALAKGGRNINYRVLSRISTAWVTTPVIAGIVSFFSLFFMQNVFDQQVYRPVEHQLKSAVMVRISAEGIDTEGLQPLVEKTFSNARTMKRALVAADLYSQAEITRIVNLSEIDHLMVPSNLSREKFTFLEEEQYRSLENLRGRKFLYKWQLVEELGLLSSSWLFRKSVPENMSYNETLTSRYRALYEVLRVSKETFESDFS